MAVDLGLSSTQLQATTDAYWWYMSQVYAAVLKRGKFSWQQLWTGQPAGSDPSREIGSTCPGPLVQKATCAENLRSMCTAESPAQTRAMMYAFSPGKCNHAVSPQVPEFDTDLTNFLLVRGQRMAPPSLPPVPSPIPPLSRLHPGSPPHLFYSLMILFGLQTVSSIIPTQCRISMLFLVFAFLMGEYNSALRIRHFHCFVLICAYQCVYDGR